ncbi:1765_t:CDS:1, partial [Funneliformis mosseae]
MTRSFYQLMCLKYKDESLKYRLLRFILNHSSIEYLNTSFLKAKLVITHPSFKVCFLNLKEFETTNDYSPNFFKELSKVCVNIQVFRLHCNSANKDNSKLAKLIEVQNRVKKVYTYKYLSKSGELEKLILKDAISSHDISIVEYHSNGFTEMDLSILRFQNLVSLHLENYKVNEIDVPEFIKSTSFPNLQEFTIIDFQDFHRNLFLNISNFIEINGSGLKYLEIGGYSKDIKNLKTLLLSIGRNCEKLESLTTFYDYNLKHEIGGIFENCIYLREIYLRLIDGKTINADDIFEFMKNARNLKSIQFGSFISISDDSLSVLNETWLGLKPLLLIYSNYNHHRLGDSPIHILKNYEKLGLLKYEITGETP